MAPDSRFHTLVESVPHVVYEWCVEEGFRFLSSRVEELTGYPAEELLCGSPNLAGLIVDGDQERVAEARRAVEEAGGQFALQYRLRQRGGDIVWVADHASARRDGERLFLSGILVDMRADKLLEAKLLQQSRLATLGELAAGVAHEVNNPLSGVLNYAQLAERLASNDPKLQEALAGIQAEGQRILDITQALLTFTSRADDEKFRPISPLELVRASLTLMRRQLREEFVTLSVDVSADLPAIQARGQELQQVLQNLLVNARHALNARFPERDPGKELSVRARHMPAGDSAESGSVEIEVQDRGIGMTSATLEKLFLPFFTTRPKGTGLGLSISRDIVQRHGGTITVDSEPGEGTTFRLAIPVFG